MAEKFGHVDGEVLIDRWGRIAVHLAVLATLVIAGLYFAVVTFSTSLRIHGLLLLAFITSVATLFGIYELRVPRRIVFGEGFVDLRATLGSVRIRDGQVLSMRPGILSRTHSGSPPARMILRYVGGARRVMTDSPDFAVVIRRLRERNPRADIRDLN